MADGPTNERQAVPISSEQRLESWKEIAGYLKRDIRTVQRWEKREGLPVHRHLHDKLGTVYAFGTELDQWWRARGVSVDPQPDPDNGELAANMPVSKWRWAGWAALGAVGVTAILAVARWTLGENSQPQPTFARVATVEGTFSRSSPNGKWLTYFDSNTRALMLKDRYSPQVRTLFDGRARGPVAWSKDSQRIAFLVEQSSSGGILFELRAQDITSSEQQVFWRGIAAHLAEPQDWVDDHTLLCRVRSPGNQWHIAVLRQGKAEPEIIATVSREVGILQASPNGKFVAYAALRDNNRDVFLRRLTPQSPEIRISDSPARESSPLWTPDGKFLIFLRQRGTVAGLWAARISPETGGKTEEVFLRAMPDSRNQLVSIDHQGEILFSHRTRNSRVFLVDVEPETGQVMGPPRSSFDDDSVDPVWAHRNGLGYLRKLPDSTSVFALRNVLAGNEREYLMPPAYDVYFLAHIRNENEFTFYGRDPQGKRGFFEYDAQSDKISEFFLTEDEVRPPARLSPDGSEFLYSVAPLADGRHPIRILNRRTGQLQTKVLGGTRPFAKWSPGGASIAYTDRNCLYVIPRAAGEPRLVACAEPSLVPSFAMQAVGGLAWSPDGRKLAWIVNNAAQRRIDLWVVDVATGKQSELPGERDYGAWPADPSWLKNPGKIAFRMEYKPNHEIWALQNILPIG